MHAPQPREKTGSLPYRAFSRFSVFSGTRWSWDVTGVGRKLQICAETQRKKLEAAGEKQAEMDLRELSGVNRLFVSPPRGSVARGRANQRRRNSCSQACFCHCSFCSPHRPACCCLCSCCSHRPARTSPRPNRHSRCRSYAGDGSARVAWCTARRAASRRRRLCPQPRRVLSSARFQAGSFEPKPNPGRR